MSTTTHTMRNGFCTQCGELEEWLTAQGETMVPADDSPAVSLTKRQMEILGEFQVYGGPQRRTNQATVDALKVAGLLGYDGDETNTRTSGRSFGITARGEAVLAGQR